MPEQMPEINLKTSILDELTTPSFTSQSNAHALDSTLIDSIYEILFNSN